MNVGRSIKIALAKSDKNFTWLAQSLDVSKQQVSKWNNNGHVNSITIERLASAFNMRASEFIALGEEDIAIDSMITE